MSQSYRNRPLNVLGLGFISIIIFKRFGVFMGNFGVVGNRSFGIVKNAQRWRLIKRKKQVLNCCMGLVLTVATGAVPGFSYALDANALPDCTGTSCTGTHSITGNVLDVIVGSYSKFDYNTYNIGSAATVNLSGVAGSVYVAKINGANGASEILGNFNGTGITAFLMNTAGITFGTDSHVTLGSLVASTASDVNLNNGKYEFTGFGASKVINNSNDIKISNGGFAVLAAPYVENNGSIIAQLGRIELASTDNLTVDAGNPGTTENIAEGLTTVDFRGDGLISYSSSTIADLDSLEKIGVTNTGTLQAGSGYVKISAQAASAAVESVINLSGVIDVNAFDTDSDAGKASVSSSIKRVDNQSVAGDINMVDLHINASAGEGHAGGNVEIYTGAFGLLDFSDSNGNINLTRAIIHADGGDGKGGTVNISSDQDGVTLDGSTITANGGGIGNISFDFPMSSPSSIGIYANGNVIINNTEIGADGGGGDTTHAGTINILSHRHDVRLDLVNIHMNNKGLHAGDGLSFENYISIASLDSGSVYFNSGTISADGGDSGNGGYVGISTGTAGFINFGVDAHITARGGVNHGDGGVVGILGQFVHSMGNVDASATHGANGNFYIFSGSDSASGLKIRDGAASADSAINAGESFIYEQSVENISRNGTNVILVDNNIVLENLTDNNLQGGKGDIFLVGMDSVKFNDKNDTLTVPLGNISIEAGVGGIDVGNLTAGSIDPQNSSNAIYLNTSSDTAWGATAGGDIETGNLTVINNSDSSTNGNGHGAFLYVNQAALSLPINGNVPHTDPVAGTGAGNFKVNGAINVSASNDGDSTAGAFIAANNVDVVGTTTVSANTTTNGNASDAKLKIKSDNDINLRQAVLIKANSITTGNASPRLELDAGNNIFLSKNAINFEGSNFQEPSITYGGDIYVDGYNKDGFDASGFDKNGFNLSGINKDTNAPYNLSGNDVNGNYWYDAQGYDYKGFNKKGFNLAGLNRDTGTQYDVNGFDKFGNRKPVDDTSGRRTASVINSRINHGLITDLGGLAGGTIAKPASASRILSIQQLQNIAPAAGDDSVCDIMNCKDEETKG